jgi:hypothetical protein
VQCPAPHRACHHPFGSPRPRDGYARCPRLRQTPRHGDRCIRCSRTGRGDCGSGRCCIHGRRRRARPDRLPHRPRVEGAPTGTTACRCSVTLSPRTLQGSSFHPGANVRSPGSGGRRSRMSTRGNPPDTGRVSQGHTLGWRRPVWSLQESRSSSHRGRSPHDPRPRSCWMTVDGLETSDFSLMVLSAGRRIQVGARRR